MVKFGLDSLNLPGIWVVTSILVIQQNHKRNMRTVEFGGARRKGEKWFYLGFTLRDLIIVYKKTFFLCFFFFFWLFIVVLVSSYKVTGGLREKVIFGRQRLFLGCGVLVLWSTINGFGEKHMKEERWVR